MGQIEKQHEFSDAQAMPNATSVIGTNVINFVENLGFAAQNRPLWIVVTCNTVPTTGTSIACKLYRHTTATITSGKLLMTSEVVALADMSANPRATGAKHILAIFAFPPRSDRDADETEAEEHFGLVYTTVGDMSSGKVDAYVTFDSPMIHTTQVNDSNIT